mgnify:CR=1 FL=1
MQELKWCQLELKRAITTSHEASRAQSLADPEQHPDEAIGWIGELMSDYPFLFPIVVREEFFRVSAFGAARAVEWLRLQRQQHQNAGSNAPLGDRLGPLRVERWLIRRDDFLNQARRLLCHHSARRSLDRKSVA